MRVFSRLLVCAVAGALIAGCGTASYRAGKGNDHEAVNRPANQERQVVKEREVVYVERAPTVIYQPVVPAYRVVPAPQPTYRVVTSQPAYSTVTTRPAYPAQTYTVVPVTRYYYYD